MARYQNVKITVMNHAMAKPKALSVPVHLIPPHSQQIDAASGSPVSSGSNRAPNTRNELKTAAELAAMIEADLAQHPECPKSGFRITVYGATHWRAMLRSHQPPVEFANRKSG
jgi:hypothetical protein